MAGADGLRLLAVFWMRLQQTLILMLMVMLDSLDSISPLRDEWD